MDNAATSKTLVNTFLYNKYPNYEKMLFEFIMNGLYVDKTGDGFDTIKADVKRYQVSEALVKVMMSDNIILIIPNKSLPKAFKVFAAKDIKGDKKLKVFIDCSGVLVLENGVYKCTNINVFLSHIVSAMNALIYYVDPKRIVMNTNLNKIGASAFAKLFTNIINYIYKINNNTSNRDKCLYLSSMYYLYNILGKEFDNEGSRNIAKQISGLSDREEDVVRLKLEKDSFLNIKFFIETVADSLRLEKLTLDLVVEKWMYLYGPGTVFGLELYPSFASMLTDTYIGAYINNQKTIEKITGNSMVEFTKIVLQIGAESI